MATAEAEDSVGVARRVADALEAAGIAYAIGGAVALAYWGAARGTLDVDVNVFTDETRAAEVTRCLTAIGVHFEASAVAVAARGESVRGRLGSVPVDLFFNSIPLHESAQTRAVTRPLLGRPIRILAAEDLTLFKLLFFRGKDIVDIERLVALQGAALDRAYVRRWLVECVEESDPRVARWDAITAALPAA